MNAKSFLLAVLALFLLITFVSASDAKSSLPPKRAVPPKRTHLPKAPPNEYIPAQEAKKAAKKLKVPVPKGTTKKVDKEIPKTRDEL